MRSYYFDTPHSGSAFTEYLRTVTIDIPGHFVRVVSERYVRGSRVEEVAVDDYTQFGPVSMRDKLKEDLMDLESSQHPFVQNLVLDLRAAVANLDRMSEDFEG
jgi:hypothetical protein